jgi:hypothetical protein
VGGASLFAIVGGIIITLAGEYQLLAIGGAAVATIACGLTYTLDVGSSAGAWIGYQILLGIGFGSCSQLAITVGT